MLTKEELRDKLITVGKKTSEEIEEIVTNYETNYLKKPKSPLTRSPYDEVREILGLNSLNEVRFYKIANLSAVVIRDVPNNSTIVSFSIYNRDDLSKKLSKLVEVDRYEFNRIGAENSSPRLFQITIGKNYESCKQAAINYRDNKYTMKFEGLRISELAVYEAWIKLAKNKVFPRYIRTLNLDVHVVSLTLLDKYRHE